MATATCTPKSIIRVEQTSTPSGWDDFLDSCGDAGFHQRPGWTRVLQNALRHKAYFLQAVECSEETAEFSGREPSQRIVGVLPLALVESLLFGRFLVSLPYVNTAGVCAESEEAVRRLLDRAVELADSLDVKHFELRHERRIAHPRLNAELTSKVHMRLELPGTADELWDGLKSKVRNQVRKGLKNTELAVHWGGADLLDDFYDVFCRNMRDLGTPPFARRLFAEILAAFPKHAEICSIRLGRRPVAAALLVHGPDTTEVPSAGSLRRFNKSCANMLMYWHLLRRAVECRQRTFDFGRSTLDGPTFRFKRQWGAEPSPAVWQYYVRKGNVTDMRPESGKYNRLIEAWKRLPVWMTRLLGPSIVRGIP